MIEKEWHTLDKLGFRYVPAIAVHQKVWPRKPKGAAVLTSVKTAAHRKVIMCNYFCIIYYTCQG